MHTECNHVTTMHVKCIPSCFSVSSCFNNCLPVLLGKGRRREECGHIMASLDPHSNCVRCRECNLASAPCAVCLAMTPVQRDVPCYPTLVGSVAFSVAKTGLAVLARLRANIAQGLLRSTDQQPRDPLSLGGEILEQLPLRAVVARRPAALIPLARSLILAQYMFQI